MAKCVERLGQLGVVRHLRPFRVEAKAAATSGPLNRDGCTFATADADGRNAAL
jgi:hypothetical protein